MMSRAPRTPDVEAAFADEPSARLLAAAGPALMIAQNCDVRWCNDAALTYFGVSAVEELTKKLAGSDPGSK
jgi:hypothetical protein